jgi:zinc D-Ala-D-Ala dipeptidase
MSEYLVEVTPGRQLVYRTPWALRAAMHDGTITADSRILHRATSSWVCITKHPEYRRYQAEISLPPWFDPSPVVEPEEAENPREPPEEEAAPVAPVPARAGGRGALALRAVAAALVAVAAGLWLLWGTQRPSAGALARDSLQESGSVVVVEPDSSSVSAPLPADSGPVAPGQRHSAAARIPSDSGLRPPGYASDAAAESLLVDARSVDSTIQVDLRYATANNFTGVPLPGYEASRALLRREVATALGRVQARLRTGGLGLRILDAYRPVRATLAMVDWAERTGHRELLESGYIARRSRHNLGVAVDLTLVDLVTGTEVPMGTAFDSFAAAADTANATGRAPRYPEILRRTMVSEGFSTYAQAWWHFSYPLEGAVPFDRVIR